VLTDHVISEFFYPLRKRHPVSVHRHGRRCRMFTTQSRHTQRHKHIWMKCEDDVIRPIGARNIARSVYVGYVILSVCLSAHISKSPCPNFSKFFCRPTCYLWPWFGQPLITMLYVTYFRLKSCLMFAHIWRVVKRA